MTWFTKNGPWWPIRKTTGEFGREGERVGAWNEERETKTALGKGFRKKKPNTTPRLTGAEKVKIDDGLRPTSIIDYLYRLRMRSNYEDPTMFTDGPETVAESQEVHRYLGTMAHATLLIHELHVQQLIGEDAFAQLVRSWLSDAGSPARGLGARSDLLLV